MDDKTKDLPLKYLHPLELLPEHWETIRKIAHEIMTEHKYSYTMSCVIAYVEWFEMVDMDRTHH